MIHSLETDKSLPVQVFSTVDAIPSSWDELNAGRDLFLSRTYLKVLESNPPGEMRFRYVLLMRKSKPIACLYFQWLPFRAMESLTSERDGVPANPLAQAGKKLKHWLAGKIRWNTLVLGNLLLTGEHHSVLESGPLPLELLKSQLPDILNGVMESLEQEGKRADMILAKDFEQEVGWIPRANGPSSFFPFTVRPNMVVRIRPDWTDESAYLADMQSKYRIRMRKARRRKDGLILNHLSTDQIRTFTNDIHRLYQNIADKASFNLFYLHKGYFRALKEAMGDSIHLYGYFLDGRLVAFYSLVENGPDAVAHFVGFENGLLKPHDLYLNMLLDMVSGAISLGKKNLIFARTATEIKSSVGAVPLRMYCFAQHRNQLAHRAMPVLLNYLQPESEDKIRHPFKEK